MTQPNDSTHALPDNVSLRRRALVVAGLAACAAGIGRRVLGTTATPSPAKRSATVTIEGFSALGKSLGRSEVPRIEKSEAEWRQQLTPASFEVTRHEATEPPFSGEYDQNHQDGLYRCVCCDTALFDSRTKFDSRTGWPSFWQVISRANVAEASDRALGMVRTAVACQRCDAHLGHVFEDGPQPTGLRYCMNSVSLRFVRRA
jgi:peptide-methionine (R)-S-oxide reductase